MGISTGRGSSFYCSAHCYLLTLILWSTCRALRQLRPAAADRRCTGGCLSRRPPLILLVVRGMQSGPAGPYQVVLWQKKIIQQLSPPETTRKPIFRAVGRSTQNQAISHDPTSRRTAVSWETAVRTAVLTALRTHDRQVPHKKWPYFEEKMRKT